MKKLMDRLFSKMISPDALPKVPRSSEEVRTHILRFFTAGFLSPKRYAREKREVLSRGFDVEGEEITRKVVKRYASQPSLCQGRYNTKEGLEERRAKLVPDSKFFYP